MLRAGVLRSGGLNREAGGGTVREPSRAVVVGALGTVQILAWGSSYYLPAALAVPIASDTGWPLPWVVGGLSLGLVVAGLVSPRVGRAIEARGGRPVMAWSSALLGAGLVGLALAPSLPLHLAAWVVIGLGMGAGLYDAAIATLGRLYGRGAMGPIVNLTLLGGFASTVCWPLSVALNESVGWRGACLAYAALHLAVALPLHLALVPSRRGEDSPGDAKAAGSRIRRAYPTLPVADRRLAFAIMAAVFTLAATIVAVVSVHVIAFLGARGLSLADAVATAALIGPAQVGARVIQALLGRFFHPIWTLMASVALMALGLAVLAAGFPLAALPLVVYAAGVGIESIARGHMPLALFGPEGYAALIGRLAMPVLLAQALAPPVAALAFERVGAPPLLAALAVAALANVGLGVWLLLRVLRHGSAPSAAAS